MRRPFRSRCFGTCHFCIKTSPHGYKLHAIVRKLQELKLRYSVISYLSYLSYHSFNILDDLPKSDISYFLSITVPSAVRIRRPHPPSASALYRVPDYSGRTNFQNNRLALCQCVRRGNSFNERKCHSEEYKTRHKVRNDTLQR